MVPPMRIEDGSSQFLPGHAAFSDTLHLRRMYQMSINKNAQPQGPSFLEMLGQGYWSFSQPPIMNVHRRPNDGICQQHGPTENHVTTTNHP
uniref:Uncharacterized protein n=1 Tax=Oryza rufipogon TaxID=4529 RepID=A0A0E0N030_ORYRU